MWFDIEGIESNWRSSGLSWWDGDSSEEWTTNTNSDAHSFFLFFSSLFVWSELSKVDFQNFLKLNDDPQLIENLNVLLKMRTAEHFRKYNVCLPMLLLKIILMLMLSSFVLFNPIRRFLSFAPFPMKNMLFWHVYAKSSKSLKIRSFTGKDKQENIFISWLMVTWKSAVPRWEMHWLRILSCMS